MALTVIGAGYPRTGTSSLRDALDLLGLGPCYHMSDVFFHPEHTPYWIAAAEGRPVNWDTLFAGYGATTDAPSCFFYRQIAAHWPQAKVILALRDPESWYCSTQETVLSAQLQNNVGLPPELSEMLHAIKFHPDDASSHDKAAMIARFNAHNDEVRRVIAPERLLIYDVKEGWDPLCAFLGASIPDAPFPRTNTTADFRKDILGES